MNNLTINTETQEFVWKINTKPTQKTEKQSKQPVIIKNLIEKALDRLAFKLIQRINNLEEELAKIKQENTSLKQNLAK